MVFPWWRKQNKRIEPQFVLPTFGLQQKLVVAFTVLILGLIISLMYVVESHFRSAIVAQVEKRGIMIAEQLAAVSLNALMEQAWTPLDQDVKQVSRDPDVLYAIILKDDGRVAAHSEKPALRDQPLPSNPVNQNTIETRETLVQYVPRTAEMPSDAYDVAAPVFYQGNKWGTKGKKWGTARVALSLQDMHDDIRNTRLWIVVVGGIGGVLSLVAVAWLAGRMAAPIQDLTEGTQAIARGELEHVIPVRTRDEIAVLARNFNHI